MVLGVKPKTVFIPRWKTHPLYQVCATRGAKQVVWVMRGRKRSHLQKDAHALHLVLLTTRFSQSAKL